MIGICVESSHTKGMGHLFRSMNLASFLHAHGRQCIIILLEKHAPSIELLKQRDLPVRIISTKERSDNWEQRIIAKYDIDRWINDRLDTDNEHALRVKACRIPLITFDDTGSGAPLSDLHIAPLAGNRYVNLKGKRVFADLRYLILDPELKRFRRQRKKMNSLLVSLGGSDTHGVVVHVVRLLKLLGQTATIHIGPAFNHHGELEQAAGDQFDVVSETPSMGALYARHDLAITGGGITPFEAMATGMPCIVIANESFEIQNGRMLEAKKAACFAGYHADLMLDRLQSMIDAGVRHIVDMSAACLAAVSMDGAKNVYDAICRYT
jgi:spore coat polysaccharide biosynthesis predicted glycosyltransferase SpsG